MMAAAGALLMAGPAAAQAGAGPAAPTEITPLVVVETLFDGMREGDTDKMRSTFHPEARLVTTGTRNGQPVAGIVPIERWFESVAGADQVLDERIYDATVHVDGNLAVVWTYYTLHVGGRFSHCGYDAFQLVRTADGWKIIEVADTRRTEGCDGVR